MRTGSRTASPGAASSAWFTACRTSILVPSFHGAITNVRPRKASASGSAATSPTSSYAWSGRRPPTLTPPTVTPWGMYSGGGTTGGGGVVGGGVVGGGVVVVGGGGGPAEGVARREATTAPGSASRGRPQAKTARLSLMVGV